MSCDKTKLDACLKELECKDPKAYEKINPSVDSSTTLESYIEAEIIRKYIDLYCVAHPESREMVLAMIKRMFDLLMLASKS